MIIASTFLIFLQSGFSYYISNQSALLIVVLVFGSIKGRLSIKRAALITFLLLIWYAYTLSSILKFPSSFSATNHNELSNLIKLFMFTVLFLFQLSLVRITYQESEIMKFIKAVRAILNVFFVFSCCWLMNLANIRNIFLNQNINLVTNYRSAESIQNDTTLYQLGLAVERADFTYGEPSMFALITGLLLITCITSKKIDNNHKSFDYIKSLVIMYAASSLFGYIIILMCGLYMVSLRIFALPNALYSFRPLFYACIILFFGIVTIDRLSNLSESVSLIQRFGAILTWDWYVFISGGSELRHIGENGIHNGLIKLLLMGGLITVSVVAVICADIYMFCNDRPTALICTGFLLIIIMQSGDLFSPLKFALMIILKIIILMDRDTRFIVR